MICNLYVCTQEKLISHYGNTLGFCKFPFKENPKFGLFVFPQSNINSTLGINNNINRKYHSSCSHYGYLYNTLMETMFTYIPILGAHDSINGKYHSVYSQYRYLYNTLMEIVFNYIPILGANDNINEKYFLFPLWVSLPYINENNLQLHSRTGC